MDKLKELKLKGNGPTFLGWLTLLFIGLKLTGEITWAWFWVLSPILIPWIFIIVVVFFVGIYMIGKSKK